MPHKKLPPEAREEVARQYALGESSASLAERFDITQGTVRNITREFGVERGQKEAGSLGNQSPALINYWLETKKLPSLSKIKELLADGNSQSDIARMFEASRQSVSHALNRPRTLSSRKTKVCSICGWKMLLLYFHHDKTRSDGYSARCKRCDRAKNSRYFRETYYPEHKAEIIGAVVARRRAKKASASD